MNDDSFADGCALVISILITIIGLMYFVCVDDWKVGRTYTENSTVVQNKLTMENDKNIRIYENNGGNIVLYKEFILPKGEYIIIGRKK